MRARVGKSFTLAKHFKKIIPVIFYLGSISISRADSTCPRDAINQMLIIAAPRTQEELAYFKSTVLPESPNLGGFHFFGSWAEDLGIRSPNDFRKVFNELSGGLKTAPFLTVDYELADNVRRLNSVGMRPLPSPEKLTAMAEKLASPEIAKAYGQAAGNELRRLGVTLNFAPVADSRPTAKEGAMDARLFSGDPKIVAKLTALYAEGMQSSGVVATAKHFPNLGDSAVDSHHDFVVINKSWDEMTKSDLLPFITNIQKGVGAIMPGFARCPQLDPEEPRVPFSKKILGRLRNDLQFKGLIVSDIVLMGGLSSSQDWAKYATMAIVAGHDMVVIASSEAKATTDYMCKILSQGNGEAKELADRIQESNLRIADIKNKIQLPENRILKPLTNQKDLEVFQTVKLDLNGRDLINTAGQVGGADYLSIALALNAAKRISPQQRKEWEELDRLYSSQNYEKPVTFQCRGWESTWSSFGDGDEEKGFRKWIDAFRLENRVPFPKNGCS